MRRRVGTTFRDAQPARSMALRKSNAVNSSRSKFARWKHRRRSSAGGPPAKKVNAMSRFSFTFMAVLLSGSLYAAEPCNSARNVIAALSRAGCNQGACHGSPQGKNNFRLSLRGYDADLDYSTIVREMAGRRLIALRRTQPDLVEGLR